VHLTLALDACPGIPAAVIAEFAGYKVPGLPFFAPETITTDHGSVYKNHHLVDVQRIIGANISRRGCSGRPISRRASGADPESDAVLTIDKMEHLIATWIVAGRTAPAGKDR
jgi:hypothetical protein